MMEFLMALYILVLFLLPPVPSACPEKLPRRHTGSFISTQLLLRVSPNRWDRPDGRRGREQAFFVAQFGFRGIPRVTKTDGSSKPRYWDRRQRSDLA